MADESVAHNLERMAELDFAGWNGADWEGVFTRYHTDDVLVGEVCSRSGLTTGRGPQKSKGPTRCR